MNTINNNDTNTAPVKPMTTEERIAALDTGLKMLVENWEAAEGEEKKQPWIDAINKGLDERIDLMVQLKLEKEKTGQKDKVQA